MIRRPLLPRFEISNFVVRTTSRRPRLVSTARPSRAPLASVPLLVSFRARIPATVLPATAFLGVVLYQHPEQVYAPDTVDARSDVYSLGIVLYRMATGRVPFQYDEPERAFEAHLDEVPQSPVELNPEIPDRLCEVILRCLEKEPGRRFQSAREVYVW